MVQVNLEMAWNFSEREKISFAQEITVWIEKKSFLCEKLLSTLSGKYFL